MKTVTNGFLFALKEENEVMDSRKNGTVNRRRKRVRV